MGTEIKPLHSKVVVEVNEREEKTPGGIFLPSSVDVNEVAIIEGIVIAVGEGTMINDKLIPVSISVGDKVLFGKFAATKAKVDEKEFYIVEEDDIIAILIK